MRLVFGSAGFTASASGQKLAAELPDWTIEAADGDDFLRAVATADVVVPMLTPITAEVMDAGSFGLIQQFGVGVDVVDLAAATARGIPVANLPGRLTGNSASVAEMAILFMLALVRDLEQHRANLLNGVWDAPTREPSLFSGKILLVGLGDIGRNIARRLTGFDVEVSAIRAHPEAGLAPGVTRVFGPDALKEQVGVANIVVACAPFDPAAGPMFTREVFEAFGPETYFINVGRGGLVDELALYEALESGKVQGAALDVFAQEPVDPSNRLVQHPKVIATPHIAGITRDMIRLSIAPFVANLERYRQGLPVEHIVNAVPSIPKGQQPS